MTLEEHIGALIRALRDERGFSQEALGERAGLHRTYIGALERGEKSVTVATLAKIAQALGVTLTAFFQRLEAGGDDGPAAYR